MKELRISKTLSLPLDWITYATVVYGNRGTGKTSFGRVAAEEATKAGQRFCAIDLKGDWWGLKSSADGKSEGIPIVIFGGEHADVPLDPSAGTFVGQTVAELGQSCVLDFELLSKGKQIRFLAEFFEALYHYNRDPLLLLLDEAQRYAPQKPGPDEARTLGAVQDLVKLGRKHGLGPVLFTQRGAGLNKEVSELCDLLVAFRTPGSLDQDRVKNWLEANATDEERKSVMSKLSGLATGTAMFASSHPEMKLFGVHGVRRPETFDSSATPKVGEKRIEAKKLAAPDLDELRQKMASAIERVKAEDPKALRERIAELEQELADAGAHEPRIVEVPAISEPMLQRLERAIDAFQRSGIGAVEAARELSSALPGTVTPPQTQLSEPPKFRPIPNKPRDAIDKASPHELKRIPAASTPALEQGQREGAKMPLIERAILTGAAQLQGREITLDRLAMMTGYHARAKTFRNGLGALRSRGAIQGTMITEDGLRELGHYEHLPSGRALLRWYCDNKLSPSEGKLLTQIANCNAGATIEDVAELAGYHPRAKTFRNNLGRLRTMGLVDGLRLSGILR
jgi:hypothetical protein